MVTEFPLSIAVIGRPVGEHVDYRSSTAPV